MQSFICDIVNKWFVTHFYSHSSCPIFLNILSCFRSRVLLLQHCFLCYMSFFNSKHWNIFSFKTVIKLISLLINFHALDHGFYSIFLQVKIFVYTLWGLSYVFHNAFFSPFSLIKNFLCYIFPFNTPYILFHCHLGFSVAVEQSNFVLWLSTQLFCLNICTIL